jgi:hypothetical protein
VTIPAAAQAPGGPQRRRGGVQREAGGGSVRQAGVAWRRRRLGGGPDHGVVEGLVHAVQGRHGRQGTCSMTGAAAMAATRMACHWGRSPAGDAGSSSPPVRVAWSPAVLRPGPGGKPQRAITAAVAMARHACRGPLRRGRNPPARTDADFDGKPQPPTQSSLKELPVTRMKGWVGARACACSQACSAGPVKGRGGAAVIGVVIELPARLSSSFQCSALSLKSVHCHSRRI